MERSKPGGPLRGIKVIEIASIGPGPLCGMLLSDMGASVLRIDRPGTVTKVTDVTRRGRWATTLDLKSETGRNRCLEAIQSADVLFEGFRPGVMERLGLGPDAALALNPRLVYARLTGWGQSGPYSHVAGHDLNYIAISGALAAIGPSGTPIPPLNLIGDYAGGTLYALMGILAALVHARTTGNGQVVDAAMSDGAASLLSTFFGLLAEGKWSLSRGTNILDGGAPFYQPYRCSDGEWITIAPMEPQFYALMVDKLDLAEELFRERDDRTRWPEQKAALATLFGAKPASHWCGLLEGTDVCFAPVMRMDEAPSHPHNVARRTFVEVAGIVQPAPAPRFSATPGQVQAPPRTPSNDVESIIGGWLSGALPE